MTFELKFNILCLAQATLIQIKWKKNLWHTEAMEFDYVNKMRGRRRNAAISFI